MRQTNPKVDAYLSRAKLWQEESRQLRTILLGCHLTEDLKWGKPCYSVEGGNVAIIQGFKAYCALLFFKGFLLKDPSGILQKTGENTRVGRQVRFTSVREITKLKAVLKAYIGEAIEVEKSGLKGSPPEKAELVLPEEFQSRLDGDPALRSAFAALTSGRQRAYSFYFSAPKQSKTRMSRVEKCTPRILRGKGLND
jgi:uncharacterized protein YdeI (YjbR/CyaY-like superfamily)